MRIAFTILLNGKRHLVHNNYYKKIIKNFDKWVIVEGVAGNTGSTSWCKKLPESQHNDYLSNDGTTEFIDELAQKYSNVKVVRSLARLWENKDQQVNAAIAEIKKTSNSCFLWQIDVDEQWSDEQIQEAEQELISNNGKTGCFYCRYYVGKNQIAIGEWGEGRIEPYRRLWRWEGENFLSHEPPKLDGKNGPGLLLTPRFEHYSYYFEEDVKFKEAYYSNYEGLYDRWISIQQNRSILPIRALLGNNIWWSNTNTHIQYIE